jgi:hypothetical protein
MPRLHFVHHFLIEFATNFFLGTFVCLISVFEFVGVFCGISYPPRTTWFLLLDRTFSARSLRMILGAAALKLLFIQCNAPGQKQLLLEARIRLSGRVEWTDVRAFYQGVSLFTKKWN